MEKNLQNSKHQTPNTNKGITLVALVITIIVLLILAGVATNMAISSDGLFAKAKEAADKWNTAVSQEETALSNLYTELSGELKDDDLPGNENLKVFITEWKVSAGESITLPIYEKQEADEANYQQEIVFNYDFIVDYGDGTIAEVTSFDDEDRIHTYENTGTYEVKITGTCEGWSFKNVTNSIAKITGIKQWGAIGVKRIDFMSCEKLTGEIPTPVKNSFANLENCRALFYYCTNLNTSIPSKLFKGANKLVNSRNAFQNAGVTGEIPEDLLQDCVNLQIASFMFGELKIKSLPEDLFKNCINLKDVTGLCSWCESLTTIPEGLFSNNKKLEITFRAFRHCTSLTEVPENLLANCVNVYNIEGMFEECTKLEYIPENFLVNNKKITHMANFLKDCTSLKETKLKLVFENIEKWVQVLDAFANVTANVTILVPNNSVAYDRFVYYYGESDNITIEGYDI